MSILLISGYTVRLLRKMIKQDLQEVIFGKGTVDNKDQVNLVTANFVIEGTLEKAA